MSEYTPKYPSHEGDDSNKSSSELLAETLKPIYVPQELMLAWESHLASYSRDTHELLDQVKESEEALNTQYQSLLARVQKYEQMLQDITMDSNEFTMDSDQENFTGWNILAQASYWDYLLKKEITKLSDKINGIGSRGELVSDISNEILEGLIADNNYISNVIEALSDTPLIRELADALNTTTTSLSDLQEEYVKLAQKQVADAEALANQQVEKAEQLVEAINDSIAEQLDRIAEEAAIRTQLLQELEDKVNDASAQAAADVGELITQVDNIREGANADKASILETVNNYKSELKSDIATVNTELLGALDGVHTLVSEVRDENSVTLNELTTYKASNDVALAGVLSKVTTNISDTAANASKIDGLTSELATTNTELGKVRTTSANALSKAETAVTANSALATRVDSLAAAITDLGEGGETAVDVHAFNALKAEVQTNAAGVSSLVEQVDALGTNYTNLADGVEANTDAVSTLTVKQSEMNGDISQLSSDVTFLTSELGVTNTALNTKASNQALNNLTTKLNTTDGKVAANTQQLTQLNTDLTTVKNGLETKASTEALNNLATEVTELEDGIAVNASAITDLRSEIDTELDKKATVTAVNGLTTKVEEVEDKTTANANNILALNADVSNVVNGLANKLDASAISDYYTKSQTDDKAAEVAAGKVEEFNAGLVIGGTNLFINSTLTGELLTYSNQNRNTVISQKYNELVYVPIAGTNAGFIFLIDGLFKKGVKYVLSFTAKGSIPFKFDYLHVRQGNGTTSGSSIRPAGGVQVGTEEDKYEVEFIPTNDNYSAIWLGTATTGLNELPEITLKNLQVEEGTKATAWSPSPRETQNALDANSVAIQNTIAEVERVDEQVTATNSAQTLLEGRVGKVEGGLAKKADASALSSLDTRVGTVEGQYTSQASDITRLTNSLDTTNVNVGAAQSAAQNAMNAAGAKGKVIYGSSAPATADRLSQNLWIDTTGNANTPKRWNGSKWVAVTDKVATDAAKAVSDLDKVVKTKADVSALNSLTTKVTEEADKIAANTSSITTLNSDIVKINNDLATKANASALSDMYTKNEVDDKAAEIAAGEISKYDASLVIGGSNLIPDSYKSFRVGSVAQTQLVRTILGDGSLQITNAGSLTSSYMANFQSAKTTFTELIGALQDGEEFTVTLWFKAVDTTKLPTANPTLHIASGLSYLALNGDHAALASGKEVPYSYTRKWVGTITAVSPHLSFTPASLGGGLILTKWKIEKGNKSTDWTEASQDIQEQLDANAIAIQTTNAEVEKVDGKTITNANNIIKLTSDVTAVKNGLATKANTSALQDYYTRSETDDVATTAAAGEVAKYDASLVIGGVNLVTDSNNISQSNNGSGYTVRYEKGNPNKIVNVSNNGGISTYTPKFYPTVIGKTYTVSVKVRPDKDTELSLYAITNANGTFVAKSDTFCPANVWTTLWYTFVAKVESVRLAGFQITTGFTNNVTVEYKEYQAEEGTKATSWSPANEDTQSALDANATAIENTNAEVKKVDGRVTTESNKITALTGRVDTVEGGLSTKATVDGLNALTTRVAEVEGGISTQATETTNLKSSLATTDKIAKDALPKIGGSGSFKTFKEVLNYYHASSSIPSNIVIQTPITYSANMFRISGKGYNYSSTKTVIDFDVSGYAYQSTGSILQHGAKNNGTFPMRIRLGMKDGKLCVILSPNGTNFAYPAFTVDATVSYGSVSDAYQTGWSGTLIAEANLASSGITNIIEPSLLDVGLEITSYANAIETLTTDVSQIDETVTSNANKLIQLTSDITTINGTLATKANASALNDIYTKSQTVDKATEIAAGKVEEFKANLSIGGRNLIKGSNHFRTGSGTTTITRTILEDGSVQFVPVGVITTSYISQWASLEAYESFPDIASMFKTGDDYTITFWVKAVDTTNVPTEPFRVLIGTGMGYYTVDMDLDRLALGYEVRCVISQKWALKDGLKTISPYLEFKPTTLGGGLILTKFQLERGSVGTDWTEASQDIQDKIIANASAVYSLDTKVEDIDGLVTSQAQQITTLTSDNSDNKNALQVQAKVVDGVKANYMVKMETNGVIGGFGLIQSTGALGQVQTSFGVNANSFFIGPPNSKKQPFLVTTANQVIDGIKYPAGTYINSAIIANATIGTAHIADAAITNAKIKELDASKITTGTLDAKRIRVGSTTTFDTGYNPATNLQEAKTYVDNNTGNLLNNTTVSGTKDKWNSTPTVVQQEFFGKQVPVLQLSGTTNLAATSSRFKVDPSKAYEVSFWAKADVAVGTMYFGLYAYNGSGTSVGVNSVTRSTGVETATAATNFYFWFGNGANLPVGEWRKYVAYIMPVGTDPAGMKGIGENVSNNCKFVADTQELLIRWYNYTTAGQSTKWAANFKCVEVDPNAVIAAAKAQILADSKTQTFTAQPTTPYAKGDIYRNGSSIYVCTIARASGSYTASDWTLVGDVTANNKAADTGKVNGVAAATVVDNASKGLTIYNDVMSDLKITPVEKASLNTEWVRIQAEYNSLLSQSASLAVNTTAFRNAYTALNTTAPTMSSILSSMTTTTTLTATQRDALRTQFTNYYAQVTALNTAINDKIAANAKAYTDAIEIGGANLLYRSYDKELWIKYGSPTITIASDEYITAPLLTTKTTFEGSGGTSTLKVYRQLSELEAGKTITLSATVKNRGTKSITVNTLGLTTTTSQAIAASTSSRIIFTGTTAGGNLQFRILTSAAADAFKVDIIDLKFEYGSKATSWTPSTKEVEDLVESKARTFTAQPTIPYSKGDIWKDGTTIKVSTTTRTTGSYTAADWVLVGDVTSANTAANSNQLGGKSSSVVLNDIANAASTATTAKSTAESANNQLALWKYPNTTEIDGGKIRTNTITANQLSAAAISTIALQAQNFTVYKDPNNPYGERMVQSGGLIQIYDANNTLRLRLGIW